MIVYLITMLMVCIFGTAEYTKRVEQGSIVNETNTFYKARKNEFYILLILTFIFVGGLRFEVGSDYVAYARGYYTDFSTVIERFKDFDEPIIYLITWVCRSIWNEGTFVIFVENGITVLLVFKGIRDHEDGSYVIPLLLYILYCGWASSFGAIRQCMAAAFIFAFSKKRKDDKWWIIRYLIVCLIAFLIHKSAIFVFPILLLSSRKFDLFQILIVILVAASMPTIVEYAIPLMGITMDSEYSNHAVNSLRIAVSFAPVILLFFSTKEFRENNSFLVNMAVFNALISFTARNSALLYRFYDYTVMYLMIFIPKCSELFEERSRKLYNISVIVLFLVYFWFETRTGNGGLREFNWVFGHWGVY